MPNTVLEDLQTKLLVDGFSSPGWGMEGVIKHADMNPQLRLGETLGAVTALQMLYSCFSDGNQSNLRSMLPSAWQGLINSPLFSNDSFTFTDDNPDFSDDNSLIGAMALFLDGVIPNTSYLIIPAINERYQDYRTCFETAQWQFNYSNHSIRLPLTAGNLTFIFGSQKTPCNFTSNGVYDIQFSADWNNVLSATKIANLSSTVSVSKPNSSPPPSSSTTTQIAQTPENTYTSSTNLPVSPSTTSTPYPTVAPIPTNDRANSGGNQTFTISLFVLFACSVSVAIGVIGYKKTRRQEKTFRILGKT